MLNDMPAHFGKGDQMNKTLIAALTFLGLTGATAGQQSASAPKNSQPATSSASNSTTLLHPGQRPQKLLKSEQEQKLVKTQIEEKDRKRQVEEKWRKDQREYKQLKNQREEKDRKSQQEKKLHNAQLETKAQKDQLQEKERKARSETTLLVPGAKRDQTNVENSPRSKE
jgi:hypothetical protein